MKKKFSFHNHYFFKMVLTRRQAVLLEVLKGELNISTTCYDCSNAASGHWFTKWIDENNPRLLFHSTVYMSHFVRGCPECIEELRKLEWTLIINLS
jgi:hypothetical protein